VAVAVERVFNFLRELKYGRRPAKQRQQVDLSKVKSSKKVGGTRSPA
jgi:hypothetical protein